MPRLVLATRNPGKVREMRRLLEAAEPGWQLETLGEHPEVGEIEETGETFAANAVLKAVAVARATGAMALADDSGLEVDGLGGRPGVRSARYAGEGATDERNNALLVEEVGALPPAERTARYRCAIAWSRDGASAVVEEGAVEGTIVLEPRGDGGFGYDPYFHVPGYGRTMAELSAAEKDAISHRGEALRRMVQRLVRDAGTGRGTDGGGESRDPESRSPEERDDGTTTGRSAAW